MEAGKPLSNQNANNYVLIVVGKMGHGKSSFCKMLVNENKGNIKVQTTKKSVTLKCELYKNDFFQEILGNSCLIMDTPGLDSKSSIHLIVEDIDEMILEKKLNVMGIAYVMDIRDRDQNQEGKDYIFTFLETLRLKYCYKQSLSFSVLSKFDRYHDQEEGNEKIFKQLKEEFKVRRYSDTWEKHILWCSEPCDDIKKFKKQINGDCSGIYKDQFVRLKELLLNHIDNNTYLKFQDYVQDRKEFQKIVVSSMLNQYKQFEEFSNKKMEVQVNINIVDQARMDQIDIKKLYCEVPISEMVLLAACTPIFIGLFALNKLTSGYKASRWLPDTSSANNKQLEVRMQQKMRICLLGLISESIKFKEREMTYVKNHIIDEIQCLDFQGKRIEIKEKGKNFVALLKEGNNTVIFRCRPPSREGWKNFIQKKSRQYYDQKK